VLKNEPEFAREEDRPSSIPAPRGKGGSGAADFSVWQLAWELGYTIAIPIVLFALLGRWADEKLSSSPWLLLVGIIISILISSLLIYQRVKKLLK